MPSLLIASIFVSPVWRAGGRCISILTEIWTEWEFGLQRPLSGLGKRDRVLVFCTACTTDNICCLQATAGLRSQKWTEFFSKAIYRNYVFKYRPDLTDCLDAFDSSLSHSFVGMKPIYYTDRLNLRRERFIFWIYLHYNLSGPMMCVKYYLVPRPLTLPIQYDTVQQTVIPAARTSAGLINTNP